MSNVYFVDSALTGLEMADLQNMLWIRMFVFYLLQLTASACSLYKYCNYDAECKCKGAIMEMFYMLCIHITCSIWHWWPKSISHFKIF